MIGLFGSPIGGPIASLADYHAPPQKRLWLFIVPEFIGITPKVDRYCSVGPGQIVN